MPSRPQQPSDALPSILLVDDHPLWRETLTKVIERGGMGKVVAEASDGGEAVDAADVVRPDLVVMDMALPTMNGVEATRRILARLPETKVLVISSSEGKAAVLEAVRAGASGYLLKTAGAKDVADAVTRVSQGELVFPPKLAKVVLEEFRRLADGGASRSACRIALAGDSPVHRDGLTHVLAEAGLEVALATGEVDDVEAALAGDTADVAILDYHGGRDTGLRVAARLRDSRPEARVLVLGADVEETSAFELIAAGGEGVGYLMRDRVADAADLGDAVRRVAAGESVVDPAVVGRLVDRSGHRSRLDDLTEREREVLGLMAEGRSNQAISEQLFLSGKTLEKHIRAIFSKLGLEETPDDHRRVLAVLAYLRS